MVERYRTLYEKLFLEDKEMARRRVTWALFFGFLSLATLYSCYAWIALHASKGEMTVGDMTLYVAVFRQTQSTVQAVLSSISTAYEDTLYMSNLFSYLAIPTNHLGNRPSNTENLAAPKTVPTIEFRNVSFRYPGKDAWALRSIQLTVQPGEKIGLVGENGAGKSTFIKLLMRLYEPTEGEILLDGVNILEIDPTELRTRIGAVFQDFVKYQFTVGENIGLGDATRLNDSDRVKQAAQLGGAESVIHSLPKQYETVLGGWFEAGHELSAGQWQKIAVSRAFMRDAQVLILDEPTASIDAEAEHELFNRFQELARKRTCIVISHRFSTVRISDRIAVFHNGEIVELGNHTDLMTLNGRYAHLFRMQAHGYLD